MLKRLLLLINLLFISTITLANSPKWISEIYFRVDDSIFVVGQSRFKEKYSLAFGEAFHDAAVQAALLKEVDIIVDYSEEILNGTNPEMKEYSKLSSKINFKHSRMKDKFVEINENDQYKVYLLIELR